MRAGSHAQTARGTSRDRDEGGAARGASGNYARAPEIQALPAGTAASRESVEEPEELLLASGGFRP